MTNEEWLKHLEEAYKLSFRADIRSENWKKKDFSESEKEFLLSEYSKEFANEHQEHILEIVQIFTRYFFKKAFEGYIFCSLDKVKLEFGITLEQNYRVSSGFFYNLAKTYWTFRIQLDEDCDYIQNSNTPLFIMILREVEINISGTFFPTGGYVNEAQQRQILEEFAPDINIEIFISENPMLKKKRWLSGFKFFLTTITFFTLIYSVVIIL